MCMICNMGEDHAALDAASEFLAEFDKARRAMRRAEQRMLEAAALAAGVLHERRYRRVHKQMVRLRRAWNKIEQERERDRAP